MISTLRQLLRLAARRAPAAVPPGQRVYAVGDIHGRLDLFEALVAAIDADDAALPAADTTVILLGDLIDRGPDSAGVIAAARALQARRKVRILTGNHEEMFLQSFSKIEVLRHFLRHGGRETILSYGVSAAEYTAATLDEVQAITARAVPQADIAFLEGFEDLIEIGDYAFVHAGIEPGKPLAEQKTGDLRWIREPFLSHKDDHGRMIVHGHTIDKAVQLRTNRIGIDTGAYIHGLLTTLCLEGTTRRLIEARDSEGAIAISARIAA